MRCKLPCWMPLLLACALLLPGLALGENSEGGIPAYIVYQDGEAASGPWVDMSGDELKAMLKDQDIDLLLPSHVPDGYEQVYGLDLRQIERGIVTERQEALTAFFDEAEPEIVDLEGGRQEYRYTVPPALLDGLSHIGLLYRMPGTEQLEDEYMIIIRILPAEKLQYMARFFSAAEASGDLYVYTHERGSTDLHAGRAYTQVYAMTQSDVNIMNDRGRQAERVVMYEVASANMETQPLHEVAISLK